MAVKKKKERGRAHTCSQKIRRRATARTAYRCYVTLYLTPPSSEEETETSRGPFRLGIKSTEKRNASAVSFLRISAVKNYTSCSFFGRTAPEAAVREFVNLKALFGFLKRCSFTLLREKGNSNKNKPLTNTF